MGFINFIAELLKDPRTAIASWIAAGPLMAYGCVFLIIFIETGVVFFPFLPGDSLLFASGFFAHNGGFNIVALLAVAWAAAILGDQCNFMIGHFFGRKIIASGKVKAMTPERIKKSEDFLDKWGHLAIFLGRFFPFIRTFVPFIAGMGGMHWRNFVIYNVLGGITWSTVFTLLGYFFGGIPFVQEHFELLIIGIVVAIALWIGASYWSLSNMRRTQRWIWGATQPIRALTIDRMHSRQVAKKTFTEDDISPFHWVNTRPPTKEQSEEYIALREDDKVVFEEFVDAQEVECAAIGNPDDPSTVSTTRPGEILAGAEFYTYDDKYKNGVSQTVIPAHLSEEKLDEVRAEARKAYLALGCSGLSRCDFFVERGTGRVLCNELNTLPGFTSISMYPKLMEHEGYSYPALVDKLLTLAVHRRKGAY